MPRYKIEIIDGETYYIRVDDNTTGPNVYEVDSHDGDLTHTKVENEQKNAESGSNSQKTTSR